MENTKRVLQQGLRYENGTKHINQGGVMHTGVEMGAPQISSTVRNEMHELFENNTRISLREVATEMGVAHATVCNSLHRPYKLQMSSALTENHVRSRLGFSPYCC